MPIFFTIADFILYIQAHTPHFQSIYITDHKVSFHVVDNKPNW